MQATQASTSEHGISDGESVTIDDEGQQDEFEVERILAEYKVGGEVVYLVKWLGYDDSQCTWEPSAHFNQSETLQLWKQQLQQGDAPDEAEVARIQQRMDVFRAEEEDRRRDRLKRIPDSKNPQLAPESKDSDHAGIFEPKEDGLPLAKGTDPATRSHHPREGETRRIRKPLQEPVADPLLQPESLTPGAASAPVHGVHHLPLFVSQEPNRPQYDDSSGRTPVSIDGEKSDKTVSDMGLPQATVRRPTIRGKNGRSWSPGDLVVNLSFGFHQLGDVKVLYFPPWLRTKLLATKRRSEYVLNIHFPQDEVQNLQDFETYSQRVKLFPQNAALGVIDPYEDTRDALNSLADFLEQHDVAATWSYPDPSETLVMIIYSCRSPSWRQQFGKKEVAMFDSRLHVAVRNRGRGVQTAIHKPVKDPFPHHELAGERDSIFHRRDEAHVSSMKPRSTESRAWPTAEVETVTVDATQGPQCFVADYEQMTRAFSRFKGDKSKVHVYIAFHKSHPREAQAVREWISKHTLRRLVYTDEDDNDWALWLDSVENKLGLLLFHEDDPAYCQLRGLGPILGQDRVLCYNISFPPSAEGPSAKGPSAKSIVSMIFPRGTFLLITEASILNYPTQVKYILGWFQAHAKEKSSGWKIMLRPRISDWLYQTAVHHDGEEQKRFVDILVLVNALMVTDRSTDGDEFDAMSSTSSSTDDVDIVTKNFILSPASLPGYQDDGVTIARRDEILVEYFISWTAFHPMESRRFVVLDDMGPWKDNPPNFMQFDGHVVFRHPERFMREQRSR